MMWDSLGKMLLFFGILLAATGGLMLVGGRLFGLGRLPGDIFIQKGNFSFYFPLVTCIILSVLLTIVLNLIRR
ncbi:hypothetical protein PTH_1029 [Pelotomaculum thermopropionicum SI]|uniref:DUF2905 domain-containing protein n=1 Tax=Pelotomaculum thermopropionicum (strain DSM 13744 / JCM 10971 / SI) TaxID=370438 RepID=A5D3G3_PELTS|nr:hypothetical protein PTH_1029 [Pelotomaculum thermopropionicum SI]